MSSSDCADNRNIVTLTLRNGHDIAIQISAKFLVTRSCAKIFNLANNRDLNRNAIQGVIRVGILTNHERTVQQRCAGFLGQGDRLQIGRLYDLNGDLIGYGIAVLILLVGLEQLLGDVDERLLDICIGVGGVRRNDVAGLGQRLIPRARLIAFIGLFAGRRHVGKILRRQDVRAGFGQFARSIPQRHNDFDVFGFAIVPRAVYDLEGQSPLVFIGDLIAIFIGCPPGGVNDLVAGIRDGNVNRRRNRGVPAIE